MDAARVYAKLDTRPEGLTGVEARERLERCGRNVLAKDQRASVLKLLWRAVLNPLVLLLAGLATISLATADLRSAVVMLSMIALSVGLKLIQETRADSAAAKLRHGVVGAQLVALLASFPVEATKARGPA